MLREEKVMMDRLFEEGYTRLLKSWADDYKANGRGIINNWLSKKMESALGANGTELSIEIQEAVKEYSRNQRSLEEAISEGQSKEEWLSDKIQVAVENKSKEEQVKVLGEIHSGLADLLEIHTEGDEEAERSPFKLESKMIANSIGDLASAAMLNPLTNEEDKNIDYQSDEDIAYSQFVEESMQSDASDTELKNIAAGALVTLTKLGKVPLIPQTAPVKLIANIACLGIDNAKTMIRIARKEISFTEGMKIIGKNTISAFWGLITGRNGKIDFDGIGQKIPLLKKPLQMVGKVADAVTNLMGNEGIRNSVNMVKGRIASTVRTIVSNVTRTAVSVVKNIASGIKNFLFG